MSLIRFDEMDDMYGRMDHMMNNMMNNMFGSDPFGSAFNMMSPFSMSPFSRFMSSNALFPHSMSFGHNLYNNMTPESSYYCSSSVMSMSTDATGRPQIYEASSSTRAAPGGVRETHSSVRDSVSGLQKMSIGHHIQDRGHVMERSRNHYTGDEEQNDEYINIEEEEAPQFNSEWQNRMSSYRAPQQRHGLHAIEHGHHGHGPRREQLALPAPESSSHETHKMQRHKMSHKKHKDKKNKKPYKKA